MLDLEIGRKKTKDSIPQEQFTNASSVSTMTMLKLLNAKREESRNFLPITHLTIL